MALPSFFFAIYLGTLRSSLGYSSLALSLCVLGGLGVCSLVRELGKDPGYRGQDWKLAMCSSKEVRKEG